MMEQLFNLDSFLNVCEAKGPLSLIFKHLAKPHYGDIRLLLLKTDIMCVCGENISQHV
jgi:hypothetical protein